jgi:hypothetical protein
MWDIRRAYRLVVDSACSGSAWLAGHRTLRSWTGWGSTPTPTSVGARITAFQEPLLGLPAPLLGDHHDNRPVPAAGIQAVDLELRSAGPGAVFQLTLDG